MLGRRESEDELRQGFYHSSFEAGASNPGP